MNTKTSAVESVALADIGSRLAFFKNLQAVTNKVHAAGNADEIMLELSEDICALFNADRLTIYAVSDDKTAIVSKVKTGLNSFKDLRLPISEQSIAGYVALSRKVVNIHDVYDDAELSAINPNLRFLQEVDRRTGYRTMQMLVAPIIDSHSGDMYGVVQLINHTAGTPFTAVAEEGIRGLCETLAIAFTQRARFAHVVKSKYDSLVHDAVLSAQELERATRTARRQNVDVEQVLIAEFQVTPEALGAALSKYFSVPYERFQPERIRPMDLLKNLKREYVEQNHWLPIEETSEGIIVLCLDPEQIKGSRIVQNVFPKRRLAYRVTTAREFAQTIDQMFGSVIEDVHVGDLLSGLEDGELDGDGSLEDITAAADNELVKLVNKIIVDAYQQGASDIHIEPGTGKDKVLVRFRRDGTLYKYIEVPASYRSAMAARIKIMCDLDISERRRPQDGKIKFRRFGPLDIELRVATIPSAGGVEDVVLRILSAGEPIPLDKLGVSPGNLEKLKSCVSKPYGIFFTCGPTGSGKTTTLHSVLGFLNKPDTKIWTAEDPVEITQKGLRQVQVNRKAGLDFAAVMRSFLRADPDIIMVGEMRDKETTAIGLEASLTGHLVLATLHTNSAPESVVRLLDMGMDPFNFADALLGILAQRLAKRLCVKCREAYRPSDDEMKHFLDEYCEELRATSTFRNDPEAAIDALRQQWLGQYGEKGHFTLYRPVGCDACGNTGYKGRIGLFELMVCNDAIKRLVQDRGRVPQLLAQAMEDGMRTLKQDGMEKVLAGVTDMKQVRAVCIK
ncbi:MAG: Flp pilus assembly complex ATPase component TadA [Gammaproteobacteria bacterium]|nr:Flp pilus assembly complex ATPase component TadA [Gammaproteobacteria bacterium]MBU1415799.1 Flp pilus assembly complex ATPase component TadA [Gammaproteobacteria bacterium]